MMDRSGNCFLTAMIRTSQRLRKTGSLRDLSAKDGGVWRQLLRHTCPVLRNCRSPRFLALPEVFFFGVETIRLTGPPFFDLIRQGVGWHRSISLVKEGKLKHGGGFMKLSTITAVIFLALVSVAQLTRFLLRVEVSAGGTLVPVWWSLAAFLFTGGLAVWLWLENRK